MQTDKRCRKALHDTIWGLLFQYADLRDELSGVLLSFQLMYEDIRNSMEGIQSEMDELEEHLEACSQQLQGFQVQSGSWDPLEVARQDPKTGAWCPDHPEEAEMPYDEPDDVLPFG